MGGREVGGLANQLAAHMGFTPIEIDRVRRFWNAPRMAEREGLKAVAMFDAIARGEIKALWVMATNPTVSLPRAGAVREALKQLDLFVVSENVLSNDTVNAGAHMLLPAAAWGEKDGTVTNSERRISRQRAFLPLPGEARPDWRIVSDVALRLGFTEAFGVHLARRRLPRARCALGVRNEGTRDFDIGGLAAISDEDYDALAPVQWPLRNCDRPGDRASEQRFFADGGFFTPDRKARFIAPEPPALKEATSEAIAAPQHRPHPRPVRTMTRSGLSPRLAAHLPEPFVEVNPRRRGLRPERRRLCAGCDRARGCILKVMVSENQRPGSLFVPIHWSDQTASCVRVGELVSAQTDPYSGQPEAKATPAAIAPVSFSLRGFAQTQAPLTLRKKPGGRVSRRRPASNIGWRPIAGRCCGTISPINRSAMTRGWRNASRARATTLRLSLKASSVAASASRPPMRPCPP
jgi:assimilatory nitrate reductase catalytic subunit